MANIDSRSPDVSHGEIAIAGLELLTGYERVRDSIGWVLRGWFRSGRAEPNFSTNDVSMLRSMRDEDLASNFLYAANSNGVTIHAADFKPVFSRVKSARDVWAHSGIAYYGFSEDASPQIGFPYYHGDKKVQALDGANAIFTLKKIEKRLLEVDWLWRWSEYVRQTLKFQPGPLSIDSPLSQPTELPSTFKYQNN